MEKSNLYFKWLSVKISMKMMFYMLDFLTLKNIADPHEMPPFMGFVWLFIVAKVHVNRYPE